MVYAWQRCERLKGETYSVVAHGNHHTMGTAVQRPLDHPLFTPGHADDGACAFRGNGRGELYEQVSMYSVGVEQRTMATNLIVVLVRDQAVLGIDQNPGEASALR